MTNPALDTISDGTPDPDLSFLADFESTVMGKGGSTSEDSERSSEPTPDAVEPPPADAPAEPAPDTPSDPAAPVAEPADIPSTPLPYTVNGQQKTVDWALQVGDEGVVIPPQNVAKLQDLIQRDEWQSQQNREFYGKIQQYDALTFKVGTGAEEKEYRGLEAFRQLQADHASLDRAGGQMMAVLANPQLVTDLAVAYQQGDEKTARGILANVLQTAQREGKYARWETLQSFSEKETQARQTQESTQTQDQEYVQVITAIGKALPALTPDDLREMHDYFGAFRDRIFRPATLPEAQQLGIRPGTIIRDPTAMNQWAQSRANLRQQNADALKAAQKAAAENATRQAQPTRPAKPAKKSSASVKPEKKVDARFEGDDGSYAAWKRRLEVGKWAHEDAET